MTHPWEHVHQTRCWGTYPDVYMVRQVKAFMAQWKGDKAPTALDIGCGAGAHTWMMIREGMAVVPIDVSPTAIANMLKTQNVAGVVADICGLEMPGASFDFMLDNLSLTCVEKPPIEHIKSWLRPRGWFISASFNNPPEGIPASWYHVIGEVIETHAIQRDGRWHSLTLQKYVKP